MKIRMVFLVAPVILLAAIALGGWDPGNYVPKTNEELYGTWINENAQPQKEVHTSGEWKEYWLASDPKSWNEGTEKIASKWIDAEGSVWYKAFGTGTSGYGNGVNFQLLIKISKSGTVLEKAIEYGPDFDDASYPTKIDPEDTLYGIYYRAEK